MYNRSRSDTKALQAQAKRKATKRYLFRQQERTKAAKLLLLNSEGEITPSASIIIAEMLELKEIPEAGFHSDPRRQDFDAGIDYAVKSLISWLQVDEAKLARLYQNLERIQHD